MAAARALAAATGFITIIVVFLPLPCLCQPRSRSYYYDACAPFTCGDVTIEFPFTSSDPFCGLPGYEVSCNSSTPTLTLSGRSYQVKRIYRSDGWITVSDDKLVRDLRSGDCGSVLGGALPAANFTPLELPQGWSNITSFVCPARSRLPPDFDPVVVNYTGCVGEDLLYYFSNKSVSVTVAAAPCTVATLNVGSSAIAKAKLTVGDFLGALEEGFPLRWENQTACWDCEATGGRCGYNHNTTQVECFPCQEGCGGGGGGGAAGGSKKPPWKIITATGVPGVLVVLLLVASLIKFRERALPFCCSNLCNRSMSHSDSVDVQEFIKTYRSSLVSEYSYLDIKKMTDGFKEKLGEGGCGAVYKGKLFNGQLIAVKMLEKSNNSGQDFVNEVATIGRIHHVNIIRLMGFCCDGSRQALIYEFMPNGSLGDFVSKHDLMRQHLGGVDLLNIAVAIARGIEYLHQGCDTGILHLDIKPQNVLLDANFNPKISDFGLAKLYSRRDSAVSLTGARGTIGYIAPELFMSNIGVVSHKSDVYSYGMLLLEMVVGRKRIRALETEDSSKFYFPHWIYDQLEVWRVMELGGSIAEEDLCICRRMVMVGLWCIQTNPADRPSITRVLEMLTGRIGDIDLPPKPTLFSMPRELHHGPSSIDSHGDTLFYTVKSSWR